MRSRWRIPVMFASAGAVSFIAASQMHLNPLLSIGVALFCSQGMSWLLYTLIKDNP
jgi:hypothetical protein